jgi:hypothetical protein
MGSTPEFQFASATAGWFSRCGDQRVSKHQVSAGVSASAISLSFRSILLGCRHGRLTCRPAICSMVRRLGRGSLSREVSARRVQSEENAWGWAPIVLCSLLFVAVILTGCVATVEPHPPVHVEITARVRNV